MLHLYGELPDDKQRRLDKHIDRCAACREELEAFRAVIDRAAVEKPPVPSNRAVEGIRHAARVSIENAQSRVPRVLWGGRWYGARAAVVAAVCSLVLVAAVAVLVTRVGRGPYRPTSERPVIAAKPPAYLRTTSEARPGAEGLPREPEIITPAASVPLGLETRLANLEADTFYMGRELALETAPPLDRRFRSLEDGIVTLCLELE